MKKRVLPTQRALSLLTALSLTLSLAGLPALAAEPEPKAQGAFVNVSDDGGENWINLSQPRAFRASIPVDMTEEEAQAAVGNVVWSLLPDPSIPYLDPALYPNHTAGGPLEGWLCQDGSTPLFTGVTSAAETVDGQVCLTLDFSSGIYFYTQNSATGLWTPDYSVPHVNGGSYMDLCGYYNLTALLDGAALGSAPPEDHPL